ncbi:hypothetical protein EUGRSUZ_E01917 [Eucalyptus grandis]|uniref:RING-type E3 ubiquitin transferase n=2 Tax=Eucalyptus grandis TaxID=71139 RepID=A0A059C5F4_EUCGR|nr:hypothetical protein EUGRSUZ_E01917 [Eucalyptus grandis]
MEAAGGRSPPRLAADRLHVAVGGDVQRSKSTLSWALRNFGGGLRIPHAQQPPEDDSDRDPRDPSLNQSDGFGVRNSQEFARQDMYRMRCWMSTFIFVSVEKRYIKMQDKGKGIAQLVGEHATETLITGAGAHSGMAQLKSTSAKFVNQQADPSCYILFICKRQLIYVRERDVNKFNTDVPPSSVSVNSAVDSGLQYLRSPSIGSSALMKLKMICPWFGLREGRGSIINQNQALVMAEATNAK